MAVLLGLVGGGDLLLGLPSLGDPGNVASMKSRFKAAIQKEARNSARFDWGVADERIWWHYMGPRAVAFCGVLSGAPESQRAYQINFFRGSFGTIGEVEVDTPAHELQIPPYDFCGPRPKGSDGP